MTNTGTDAGERNALMPSVSLLVKLGSIARHCEEYMGPSAHELDASALRSLLGDPAVQEWMTKLDSMALLPVKR